LPPGFAPEHSRGESVQDVVFHSEEEPTDADDEILEESLVGARAGGWLMRLGAADIGGAAEG